MVNKKDSHFIPSPFPVVTAYENLFIKEFNDNVAGAVAEVLKYVAQATALAIKNTTEEKAFNADFEKARKIGDVHPNGKWVWTEYKPGKFDWRGVKTNTSKKPTLKSNDRYFSGDEKQDFIFIVSQKKSIDGGFSVREKTPLTDVIRGGYAQLKDVLVNSKDASDAVQRLNNDDKVLGNDWHISTSIEGEQEVVKLNNQDIEIDVRRKRVVDLMEVPEELKKLTKCEDCIRWGVKNKILSPSSQFVNVDIESARRIVGALYNAHKLIEFVPFTLINASLSRATMDACDGRRIRIDKGYFSNFDAQRYYDRVNKKYHERKERVITTLKAQIDKLVKQDPTGNKTVIDKLKKDLAIAESKNYRCWTVGDAETMQQDITLHELGHILNAQCSGGCGHKFMGRRSKEYMLNVNTLNQRGYDIFAAEKDDPTKCISEYASTKRVEWFAENFVHWIKGNTQTKEAREFFDTYFSEFTPQL